MDITLRYRMQLAEPDSSEYLIKKFEFGKTIQRSSYIALYDFIPYNMQFR